MLIWKNHKSNCLKNALNIYAVNVNYENNRSFYFELTTEVSLLFIIVAKFNPSSIWKTSAFRLETTHFS